jgi:hypothetical protein
MGFAIPLIMTYTILYWDISIEKIHIKLLHCIRPFTHALQRWW